MFQLQAKQTFGLSRSSWSIRFFMVKFYPRSLEDIFRRILSFENVLYFSIKVNRLLIIIVYAQNR